MSSTRDHQGPSFDGGFENRGDYRGPSGEYRSDRYNLPPYDQRSGTLSEDRFANNPSGRGRGAPRADFHRLILCQIALRVGSDQITFF